jgi:hypothetical protein
VICGYLLFFRVHDLDESFWLLGEQVRDWKPTQQPFTALPLAGPRSLNSGADIGPAYYWFLWLAHAVLAPLLGSFPHTGGWAISLLHTVADFALLIALWRRFESWALAAAAVILFGSSPYDAGLTATIWNPPIAAGFIKLATAFLLLRETPSTLRSMLAIVCSWLAVQMHLTALVAAVPITLWVAYTAGSSANVRRMTACATALAISLALVVLPYALNPIPREGGVGGSLTAVLNDPFGRIRLVESAAAVGRGLDLILATPLNYGWLEWMVAAGALAILVKTPLSALTACSVAVLATTVALFSLWQGNFGEYYWFLVIAPAGAIACVQPLAWTKAPYRHAIGGILLIAVFLLQPARTEFAWGSAFRLPAYGPLRRGAATVAASGQPVRNITADFAVPSGVDPVFLLHLAGGRLEPTSRLIAVIEADGRIRYRTHREP